MGLCEAFVSALIEKSSTSRLNRDSILRLLQLFATSPDFDLSSYEVDLKSLIPEHTPRVQIRSRLEEIVQKTGLVQFSGGKLSFIHDIFRSYFLALQISRAHEPSSGVWKTVDPFRIGWTTSQYVCETWSLANKDISSAVEALLSFGDNGEICAIEVSIACATVSEKIITKIVDRIFRETYSTGMTMSGHSALTRLAAQRASVKGRLIEAVYSHRDFIAARLEYAECLLGSGHLKEALNALKFIAEGEHEYHGDRIRAAELLLRNGQEKLASEVLHEMARDADDLGMRADAASILFVNDQSEANRDLVAALLKEDPEDAFDTVYESTIARLLSVGEENLALPLIRERAKPPSQADRLFHLPREEIAACRAIAAHHDRGEAVAALEELLSWEHITLRGKAEVLEALADIGTEEIARELLRKAIGRGPDYEGADWFVLEMLTRLELEKELKAVGGYLLRRGLEKPSDGIEVSEIVARLVNILDHEELAELIRPRFHVVRDTRLVSCLATLGYRDEAIDLLKGWVKASDLSQKIDAAKALCVIGERKLGVRTLNQIVKNSGSGFDIRLEAARALEQVDEAGAAAKAYRTLLCDTTLSIEERCRSAHYFNEDANRRSEIAWEVLFPQFVDDRAKRPSAGHRGDG
jgi:tetratricopeptide (TPR) repeat protein